MSVQLILYPQAYEGKYTETSIASFNQYVSNYTFAYGSSNTI